MKSRCSTALTCYSSRRFQAELFLNGPGQTGNLGAENRQQIIHSDNSEKVSMFIDYRETANAPVMHKPHGIEQVVIDVDHRRVRSHYLLYCGLRRLFFAGNNFEYNIPIRKHSYWAGFIDYYQAANVLGLHQLRCLSHSGIRRNRHHSLTAHSFQAHETPPQRKKVYKRREATLMPLKNFQGCLQVDCLNRGNLSDAGKKGRAPFL